MQQTDKVCLHAARRARARTQTRITRYQFSSLSRNDELCKCARFRTDNNIESSRDKFTQAVLLDVFIKLLEAFVF